MTHSSFFIHHSSLKMKNFIRFVGFLYFISLCSTPLSIGQEKDTVFEKVDLINPSFEQLTNDGAQIGWGSCNFVKETPPDIQPGLFGCKLFAQNGKTYIGLVARDNGTYESIRQVLTKPLKAGVCYRISVYLAKSSTYESLSRTTGMPANYIRPLKLTVWGTEAKTENICPLPDDWLTETLPIHSDQWRRYTFYIQPPKDIYALIFSANHVVEKPYNGNLLIDNISPVVPVNCTDFRQIMSGQRSVFLAMQQVSEAIVTYAPKMVFGKKNTKLKADTEGGHNKSFDALLAYFEQNSNYNLVIRLKQGKKLSKERTAFLYSYIFKNTGLKAQRVDIKQFTPKDEAYFWTFENDELAMSFDTF